MEAGNIRKTQDQIVRLEARLRYFKSQHTAALDSFLDLNQRWKKLNDDQILAYKEKRDSDVTRYDVIIRSVDINIERVCKELDKIKIRIKAVVTQLSAAEKTLHRSPERVTSAKPRSILLPFTLITGSDPSSIVLAKQHRLTGRKRRALLRCLELVSDLKHTQTRLSSLSQAQSKEENLRARFKREELKLQMKYMASQEDKLIQLDIELFDIVIADLKSTMAAKEMRKKAARG